MAYPEHEFFAQDPKFPTTLITFTLMIGAFFGYLNETLLNIALPQLMHEFDVASTTVQWVATGFLLVMGSVTPLTANVIQWFSSRIMLMLTLTIFLSGTLVCALAANFPMLMTGRLLQGLSAAFTVPLLFNSVLLIYPPERRGTVIGIITTLLMVAPAIGSTLSGIIVDHLGWRYLFWLITPFILLSLLLAACCLKVNLQPLTRPKIDWPSVVMSSLGLGILVYAAGNFTSMNTIQAAALAGIALLLLAVFVRRQYHLDTPLVDLRVFRIGQYRYAMLILAATMAVFIGTELTMPIYLQQVVQLSATAAGLVLLPGSVIQAVLAPVAGHWLDRHGPRLLVLPGALTTAAAFTLMLVLFDTDSRPLLLTAVFALLPAAVTLLMVSETHGLNALPKAMYPHGTAIISSINPIAGALGAAFFIGAADMGSHLAYSTEPRLAQLHGIRWSFALALLMCLPIIWAAWKIRRQAA